MESRLKQMARELQRKDGIIKDLKGRVQEVKTTQEQIQGLAPLAQVGFFIWIYTDVYVIYMYASMGSMYGSIDVINLKQH